MLHFLPDRFKQFYLFQMIILFTFLLVGMAVCPVVLVTYLVLHRGHKLLYKAVVNRLCYFIWIHFTYIVQWWGGLRMRVYADEETLAKFGKEHALVLLNHKYDIDWVTTWVFAEKFGCLGGARSLAKSSLRYVPIIGWVWNFNGTVFLKRNWSLDKEIIHNSLKDFSEVLSGDCNLLLLYPEGTRFTPDKLESSNEFARSKGMPELKHCLLPRSKGFIETVRSLRSQIDVVYDFTVAFPDNVKPTVKGVNTNQPRLTMKNILDAKVMEGDMTYERILIKDLPEDDKDLELWLQERFQKKDILFDYYVNNGKFHGPHKTLDPPHVGLIIYCISFTITWLLMGSCLGYVMWTGSWFVRCIIVGVIFAILLLIKRLMNVTQAEKGSKYGIKEKSK